jgi:virginiamycin B lyase
VGPDGALWFVEMAGNKVGRITPAGVVSEFTVPTLAAVPWAITAGADGAMWFAEGASNKIGRITTAGAVTEFALPTLLGLTL